MLNTTNSLELPSYHVEQPSDEHAILECIVQKDEQAFNILYHRYKRRVRSYVRKIINDPKEAEELVQDIFFQVWKKASYYNAGRGQVSSWVLTIAHNMTINKLRGHALKTHALVLTEQYEEIRETLQTLHSTDADQLSQVIVIDERKRLARFLDHLNPLQRELIHLAYYQGYTQRQIAAKLDLPLGTVKTKTRMALLKLRCKLLALAPI